MGKARQIPLYIGTRSELDRSFLQIINNLPAGTNLNEFIKQAVVNSCKTKVPSKKELKLETDQLKVEIMSELKYELYKLKQDVQNMQNVQLYKQASPQLKNAELNDEAKRLVDSLTDAF